MTVSTAILALALTAPQTGTPATQGGLVVEGQTVPLTFPKGQSESPSADLAGWRGWGYLNGRPATFAPRYATARDWSDFQSPYEATRAANGAVWRTKIVVFTNTETVGKDPQGVLRSNRETVEPTAMRELLESVNRFAAFVSASTGGKVKFVPEVAVERDLMRWTGEESVPFGEKFAREYLAPRINAGGYEAEDKVFRGPYQSVIYVVPGAHTAAIPATSVNGTPVAGLTIQDLAQNSAPGVIEERFLRAWKEQVDARARERGVSATPENWAEIVSLEELSAEKRLERLRTGAAQTLATPPPPALTAGTWRTATTEVSVATDTDRGSVLKVTEKGSGRDGGFVLPRTEGSLGELASAPTLSFWVKTTSRDPIGVAVRGEGGNTVWISLGREPAIVEKLDAVSASVPVKADETWQKIAIDLRPLAQRAGFSQVTEIAIEPSPAMKVAGRLQSGPIEASFDEFRLSADPAGALLGPVEPNATGTDPEERALFAARATASGPELIALINDGNDLVRLNATARYVDLKDPAAEPNLITSAMDINGTVGSYGIRALKNLGTPTAIETIRRVVRIGVTDVARATAGFALAETKDPKVGGDIVSLLGNRSWQTRRSAVEALTDVPGKPAGMLRMAFLEQVDPAIKLAVVRSADPADDDHMRKMLWVAVNEWSDTVRAAADIKLIQSATPTYRSEGYKGVRDDSRLVRLIVLEHLQASPSEDHRNALRLAVTDRSPAVRVAALRAFSALEKGATTEEIANVLEDRHPDVQLALAELAKKRGLKLPEKTRALMAESPDPRVVEASKGLN